MCFPDGPSPLDVWSTMHASLVQCHEVHHHALVPATCSVSRGTPSRPGPGCIARGRRSCTSDPADPRLVPPSQRGRTPERKWGKQHAGDRKKNITYTLSHIYCCNRRDASYDSNETGSGPRSIYVGRYHRDEDHDSLTAPTCNLFLSLTSALMAAICSSGDTSRW